MPRMNSAALSRWIKATASGALALFVFTLVINLPLFDEEIDPALASLLLQVEMPDPGQNAYIALWGFGGSEDRDMVTTGQQVLALHDRQVAETGEHALDRAALTTLLGEPDDSWLDEFEPCTARNGAACLAKVTAQLDALAGHPRLDLLTRRYQQLIRMPTFRERQFDFGADSIPSYKLLIRISDIALARLARNGSADEFLDMLQRDQAFWHRVLEDQDSLVAKMVSIAMLWRDAQYLSEFLHTIDTASIWTQDLELETLLQPLSPEALEMSDVWVYEMRPSMLHLDKGRFSAWTGLFMQLQATDNLNFRHFWLPLIELSRLSPAELHTWVEDSRAVGETPMRCCQTWAAIALYSPAMLYNPAGKLWLTAEGDLASLNLEDYLERLYDLQGYLRLVRLSIAMLSTGLQEPGSLLQEAGFANPHTGATMTWDSTNGTLSFECRGLGNVCSISTRNRANLPVADNTGTR